MGAPSKRGSGLRPGSTGLLRSPIRSNFTVALASLPVQDYHLGLPLASGQAFRWKEQSGDHLTPALSHSGEGAGAGSAWEGVIGRRWVCLIQDSSSPHVHAEFIEAGEGHHWLEHYLQSEIDLAERIATFP